MSRMGFTPSALAKATERAAELIELHERLEHETPATLVPVSMALGDNSVTNERVYYLSRVKLMAVVKEDMQRAVDHAHRLMHSITDWEETRQK